MLWQFKVGMIAGLVPHDIPGSTQNGDEEQDNIPNVHMDLRRKRAYVQLE